MNAEQVNILSFLMLKKGSMIRVNKRFNAIVYPMHKTQAFLGNGQPINHIEQISLKNEEIVTVEPGYYHYLNRCIVDPVVSAAYKNKGRVLEKGNQSYFAVEISIENESSISYTNIYIPIEAIEIDDVCKKFNDQIKEDWDQRDILKSVDRMKELYNHIHPNRLR